MIFLRDKNFIASIKTNKFEKSDVFKDLDLEEELKELLTVKNKDFISYYGVQAKEIFKRVKQYVSFLYFYQTYGVEQVNICFNIKDVHRFAIDSKGKIADSLDNISPGGLLRNYILDRHNGG